MDELFGVSVSILTLILGTVVALLGVLMAFISVRNPILLLMSLRNVRRRPARGALIVIGLMLATAIISIAFTVGDSVTFSIKRNATNSLKSIDESIVIDEDSDIWDGKAVPNEFPSTIFEEIAPILDRDSDIDGVLPILVEQVSIINFRSRQYEVSSLLSGMDPARAARFGTLRDREGNSVDLTSLDLNEVYIDEEGANEIGAQVGDTLGIALRPGELHQMSVKAIADGWYFKTRTTDVVLMVSLDRAQTMLEREGQLSAILISNSGDELSGVALTDRIVERFGKLPFLKRAGLEVSPIKRDAIDQANAVGNLFVSFFTTFGLFSIGVGLLLIFLIFSMLAAERRGELGMSRAIGMQRSHLIRLFMTEGAIYGVGSAIIGAIIGIGLGYILVTSVSGIFGQDSTEEFTLTPYVQARSVLVSMFIGGIVTFGTVAFASIRISRLNIVRAIRDIPEPKLARASRKIFIWGAIIAVFGTSVLLLGLQSAQLTAFGLGISFILIGVAMILRWKGVSQRWVLSSVGLLLVIYWLLPPAMLNLIRNDWNQDFSSFFVSGTLVVSGAVLFTVNNAPFTLNVVVSTLGRVRKLTPIIKSSVSYPLRYGFRTGLSVAMFAVVVFSVTVMATLLEGFGQLFDDQERLGGGYDIIALSQSTLNPLSDIGEAVDKSQDLAIVSRVNGKPSVGTFRTIREADATLSINSDKNFKNTTITGVDDNFISSNKFQIELATSQYALSHGFDNTAVWRSLSDNPGLAVVNSLLVPRRNNFGFELSSDDFILEVDGLFLENELMSPVEITVQDRKSGSIFHLTVIGVLDSFASDGLPVGIYTSTNTLKATLPREVPATQFFFNVDAGADNAANRIEAALFQHGLETIDIAETIKDVQSSQRSFFNLLIAFMTLGLVVGIAALGVISARAIVERRHEIGVMRSIGFSRRMVQMSFLAESSFMALLGISIGTGLGLLTSINVISDIRTDEPAIKLIIPWGKVILIGVSAYLFSLLTTYLPSRQAARINPAEALRYE